MSNRIPALALLCAGVACAPLALAAPPAQPAAAPQMQVQRHSVLDEIGLTPTQQQQVRAILQQNAQAMQPLVQTLEQRQATFEQTQPGSAGYQAAVNALAQTQADYWRARVEREGAARAKIHALMTQAQRDKLQQLLAQQRARLQQMRAQQQAQPAASR